MDGARSSVLAESDPTDSIPVHGLDYESNITIESLLKDFKFGGFQSTHLGLSAEIIDCMLRTRQQCELETGTEFENKGYKIFISFTSNMISSGIREALVYLAKHRLIDVLVTTAGGVEEDIIKCLGNTVLGSFSMKGSELRDKGWNRIGNLIVPNENYCLFEKWIQPLLDELWQIQNKTGKIWTPSEMIDFFGNKINDPTSLAYWCHTNKIPIFCPGLTDGSLGDNIFFHSYAKSENPLIVDIAADIRKINDIAIHAKHTGIIVLGGGLPKHHICNANLMRNGADHAVYISTAQEYDGSDSGAQPDEAVSWGKIKSNANPIKVHGDATIIFPLLVAGVFKKFVKNSL